MSAITATFAIDALAARYGFDKDEALRFIRQSLADELNKMAATPAPARAVQPGAASPKPVPRARPTPKPRKRTPPPAPVAEPAAAAVAEPVQPAAPVAEPAAAPAETSTQPGGAGDRKFPAKLLKPQFQLPWCGKVLTDRCAAVSFSYGLYTQCMNGPAKDSKLCKTCAKNASDAGVPKFGFITDRAANPEWTAPSGKRPQRYVQHWSKNLESKGITRDQVNTEAAKFGFTVPETEWIKPEKAPRKRKQKTAIALSSASGSDNDAAAAAPAPPKTKKLTKTKSSPAPSPAQPAAAPATLPPPVELTPPAEDDGADAAAALAPTDMVEQSLASSLATNPYDEETEDEDEVEEMNVSMKEIDHGDGHGLRTALVDIQGNVYCYAAFVSDGSQIKVGVFRQGVYTPIPA